MSAHRSLRIAISVNGEGRGHLTRITALARRLGRRHALAFWCPDSIREDVSRGFPRFPVRSLPALRFVMSGASLDLRGTASFNAPLILASGSVVGALAAELEDFRPDGVLSDFEPFLPEAAASLGLPVVQLNHPGIVTRFAGSDPEALVTKIVAARMMGRFDRLLLSSFYGGDLGPIIRPEILRASRSAKRGDFILVYAREGLGERFRDFARRDRVKAMRFFPDPSADFPSALAACRAVVAPAGHQMLSEALCLGKPVFAVPFAGQFEQRLNAEMLKRSGRGDWAPADRFEESLSRFLGELESYPRRPATEPNFRFRDDCARAARIVADFFSEETLAPSRRLGARSYSRITGLLGRLVPAGAARLRTG